MKKISFVFSAVLALALAGCKTSGPDARQPGSDGGRTTAVPATMTRVEQALSPELLRAPDTLFTLGPGDALELELLGAPATRTLTTVGPDGKIYFHLLRGLEVWGLTLGQTRDLLEKEMGQYMANPQVSVSLRSVASQHVWVLGRLNKPGIYPVWGPMTLLEALSQAGGTARSQSQISPTDLADLRHAFVMRNGEALPVNFYRLLHDGDTSQNIYLRPDDFVYVPSALEQEVYVLGAVRAPRAVPYLEEMTVMSALAGGSGHARLHWVTGPDQGPFTPDARLGEVTIVRGSLAEPQIMVVDCGAIMRGKAQDVLLEPGDIVYIPNMPVLTNLKRYFNMVLSTFVSTVAANEGIRAAGGDVGVGVSVPVGGGSVPVR